MTTENDVSQSAVPGTRVPGQWFAVDFHVHTVASRDFESASSARTAEQVDSAYMSLLEQAVRGEIQVMVIADHNSLEGYKRLLELKADLERTKRTLARTGSPLPAEVQRQIERFDSIVILPGTELDVDPNIHVVVIFDPQTQLDGIDHFLQRAGYPEERRGSAKDPVHAQWNLEVVCSEANEIGAVVIAAHVDSDKGLYEVSKNWGLKRAAAFTNPKLQAMEFVNPVSRDQIRSLMTQPDYTRPTPLAFVQSSDFHGREDQTLGARVTWVRLDTVKREPIEVYKAIQKALRNPDECLSAPGRPELHEIMERLRDRACIKSLDDRSDIDSLCHHVCAFANSGDNTIVIGRNEKGNLIGFEAGDATEVEDRIRAVIGEQVSPEPRYTIQVYPYYGNKFVATVRVNLHSSICVCKRNDRVHILKDGGVRQASSSEVIQLAEEVFLRRYSPLSISSHIERLAQQLSGTRDSIDVIPLVRKIEARANPLSRLFQRPTYGDVLTLEFGRAIDIGYHGHPLGDIVVVEPDPPRQEGDYIRFTACLGKLDASHAIPSETKRFEGSKLVIVSGGAVYIDHGDHFAVCKEKPPLICQPDSDYNGPSLEFLIAYLKSAIPIWYADRCLGSVDIYDQTVLARIPIPIDPPKEYEDTVVEISSQIIALEKEFLEEDHAAITKNPKQREDPDQEWLEERILATIEHNRKAGCLMAKLETTLFKMFDLSDIESAIMQDGIRASALCVFEPESAAPGRS